MLALCEEGVAGWAVGSIKLYIRYSRGADFSGSCYYTDRRIFINLGKHLEYPYWMQTYIGRAKTTRRFWYKPSCAVEMKTGYHVVMFVFMHELFHLLVKRARRNTRQKESMCDRFATRFLVDRLGATIRGPDGKPLERGAWDFQDLDRFVAAAKDKRAGKKPRPIGCESELHMDAEQLLFFPV